MIVLQCCLGEFSLYFLLAVVLGVVLRQLLLLVGHGSTHMTSLAAVGYVVCEIFASKVYAGGRCSWAWPVWACSWAGCSTGSSCCSTAGRQRP